MNDKSQAVAQALILARSSRQPCDALQAHLQLKDMDEAYAVQSSMGRALKWWGASGPRFWKTGGAGPHAVQNSAPLPEEGVWQGPGPHDATAWPMHSRGVESEIALRLRTAVTLDMARDIGVDDARGLLDAMAVAIELVDFRWTQGVQADELLKLADLQSHSALVLGEWQPFTHMDWSRQVCRTRIGDQLEIVRQGSHPFGDPTQVLPGWLRHATARFGTLPAGTVVTTGSWIGLPYAQAGDLVQAGFEGLGQVCVQL
ncbi:fumarylacetoacetate hydrolase family protein [Ottowia sp. VDI28]|uniref:fumarylacetoacetate hydrolase family protein n=1 Tax=Ottowia sp. VDI28 TaxID=3133968 RepID=UPI003C2F424E